LFRGEFWLTMPALLSFGMLLLSQLFTKTSKEAASDAASRNAELLLRGGFIHKTMAGVYAFLPLGLRVLRRIENILREEMDAIGQEVLLPSLAPTELWERTGRLDSLGVLFQASAANDASKKTNDARYVLNSTHEELITPIVQQFCTSYKDLPCAVYQIQTKFRNEARPKSGLMRGREFRMKDLYSFHTSEEDMLQYFNDVSIPAYKQFFDRIGLGDRTIVALASGGSFSKEPSREFQTMCEMGEDHLFRVPGTDTVYNREICPALAPVWDNSAEEERPLENVVGKGIIGVDELAAFLQIEVERTTKTLLFEIDNGAMVAVAVRGGYDVNEEKLQAVLGCTQLRLASAEAVRNITGAEVGYAGPLNLPPEVRTIWDDSTRGRRNFECGANVTHEHTINVNFGRDLPEPEQFHDVKIAKEGDWVPGTQTPYEVFRGSEVGNVFTLYTKFSSAFDFTFQDSAGVQQPVYMGCYGIGTSRVLGVLAEVCNDERGLIWPMSVAPAAVHIVPIAKKADDPAFREALRIAEELTQLGSECIVDDRTDVSVGFRLADADLMGVPVRLIVSPKTLEQQAVEWTDRATGTSELVPLSALVDRVVALTASSR
jgi:prolyl-tRNA synthetase